MHVESWTEKSGRSPADLEGWNERNRNSDMLSRLQNDVDYSTRTIIWSSGKFVGVIGVFFNDRCVFVLPSYLSLGL